MKLVIKLITLLSFISILPSYAEQANECNDTKEINLTTLQTQLGLIDEKHTTYLNKLAYNEAPVDKREQEFTRLYIQCIEGKIDKSLTSSLSAVELHKLYRVLSTFSFYTDLSNVLTDLEFVIDVKKQRGEVIVKLQEELYRNYIARREFDKARNLLNANPNLNVESIPFVALNNTHNRSLLKVDKSGERLYLEPFIFPKGGHVIVLSSTSCNPSQRFFKWLDDNPVISKIFKEHATAIIPVQRNLNLAKVSHWNQSSAFELKYAFNEKQWPEIPYWATPVFYFYFDGKLIDYFDGWPQSGKRIAALKQSLVNIGLQ